ncbi:MAG TPA: type II secretion system protein [Caulobacteraceae bacterium]|nr:type II secretion system protein [Caulobacteraceae bacterium]
MSATGEQEPRAGAQRGTTLIEALVVVAITALVSLVGFPRLQQGLLTLAQRQTAAVVAARLEETRADAMRADGRAVFAIAADGRGFGASSGAGARIPSGLRLVARPLAAIAFHGDGSSSGGSIRVVGGGRAVAIHVASTTGVVTVVSE